MRLGRIVGFVVLATLAVGLAPVPGLGEAVAADEDRDLEPFDEPEWDGPEVSDGHLRQAVEDLTEGRDPSDGVDVTGDGELIVEVVHDDDASVEAVVVALGGEQLDSAFGVTLAAVPFDRLVELEAHPDVDHVRRPLRVGLPPFVPDVPPGDPSLQAVAGEEVAKTNADAWHAAGHTGAGIKVGIIDSFDGATWNAALAAGEVPAHAGSFCRDNGVACNVFAPKSGGWHGVGVAEIVHEMAPDADLYLVDAFGLTDLDAAVDYLIANGVDVITRSQTAEYDGPGNGTGDLADLQGKAVAAGILWLNSAGNHAGSGVYQPGLSTTDSDAEGGHWRGTYSDADADGWHEFRPGVEILEMNCRSFVSGLRWSDWGSANPTDYDLHFWDDPPFTPGTEFLIVDSRQTLGAPPLETVPSFGCAAGLDIDYIAIRLFNAGDGAAGDILQFAVNGQIDPWTNPYSASQPFADTKSAGGLAVGAIDPPNGVTIASYSSRGPTNDGRTKPDLAAPACVESFAATQAGLPCFNGTSAATPVVAGAAALVRGAGIATTPAALKTYLLNQTVDRGPAGTDNSYGKGELILPAAPATGGDTKAPTWPDTELTSEPLETQITLDWKAATDNVGVAGYIVVKAPGVPVDGVYQGSVIAELGKNARSYTATGLQPATSYAFWIEAFDAAGNVSADGPLRVFTTATDFVDTDGDIFHDDIAWLSATGITKGCNPPLNDRFCPGQQVTRGEMAAFLGRALALSGGEGENYFIDDGTSVFETDINRLAFWEITLGCNPPANDRYCPDGPVLRGQMASFLVRALLLGDGWNVDSFIDDETSVHEFDINRLAFSGITKGCNPPANTLFCPMDTVTRGAMAAFLHRADDEINAVRALLGAGPVALKDPTIAEYVPSTP